MKKAVVSILVVAFTTMSIFSNNAEAVTAIPSTQAETVIPESTQINPQGADPALAAMKAVAMAMNQAPKTTAAPAATKPIANKPITPVNVINTAPPPCANIPPSNQTVVTVISGGASFDDFFQATYGVTYVEYYTAIMASTVAGLASTNNGTH